MRKDERDDRSGNKMATDLQDASLGGNTIANTDRIQAKKSK